MWYSVEDLDMLNNTFGDPDSSSHMPWIVATGQDDSVLKSETIISHDDGINSSDVDLAEGTYCVEAQVNNSEKEISCFDIGQGLGDNDDLDKDVAGIEIILQDNSSGNFTIETELEGNVTWDIIEFTRGDMVEEYQAQAIPVALVIDHEGFIVAKESSGTPTGGWDEFDSVVLAAANGEAEDLRFSLAEVDRSPEAIFAMGLLLGVLVYFSPCAFPILPGYISYYVGLGQREDELIEAGKIESRMPAHWILGGLAALGQLTFFAIIGVIVLGLGSFINLSGVLHYFALGVAILLIVLGAFMLTGGTAHLLGFVQKLVDKYSTTEHVSVGDWIFCRIHRLYCGSSDSFHCLSRIDWWCIYVDWFNRSNAVCEFVDDCSYNYCRIGPATIHYNIEAFNWSHQSHWCLDDDDGRDRSNILLDST